MKFTISLTDSIEMECRLRQLAMRAGCHRFSMWSFIYEGYQKDINLEYVGVGDCGSTKRKYTIVKAI